jgi:hypothetical protein
LSATTTYYAAARSAAGCFSARTAVVATINAIPAVPTGSAGARCGTGTVVLGANVVTGTTVDWYNAPTGGSIVASGTGVTSFTTPSIASTTTFYAQRRNTTTGCVSATRVAVIATVNAVPAVPTGTAGARCGTGTVVLGANVVTGTTVDWYDDLTGGSIVAGGTGVTSFTTPSIASTTTFYAQRRNTTTGCVSATRVAVIATVNAVPEVATASDVSRCGTGTVVLTATLPTGATFAWFNVASGGTALSTANPYTTASLSATTTYYVESRLGTCASDARTAVTATVNAVPAAPTGTAGSRCGAGTVVILATPAAGSTIDWYATSTGGAVLSAGSGVTSFTTPTITATTTYYAAARNLTTGCVSATSTAVAATINPLLAASASITGTTAICPLVGTTTTTNYAATAITEASTYKWTLPAGASIVGVQTGRIITVQYASAIANSSITVQGVALSGCAGNPRSLALNTTACSTPVLLTSANGIPKKAAPVVESMSVKVFPNPSNTLFNLHVTSSSMEKVQVRMLDARGSILKTITINPSNTLRIGEELRPGVYMFEVRQGANVKVVKAIKF